MNFVNGMIEQFAFSTNQLTDGWLFTHHDLLNSVPPGTNSVHAIKLSTVITCFGPRCMHGESMKKESRNLLPRNLPTVIWHGRRGIVSSNKLRENFDIMK